MHTVHLKKYISWLGISSFYEVLCMFMLSIDRLCIATVNIEIDFWFCIL